MNINDLLTRWVSTFVASEVTLTSKIQSSLSKSLGEPVLVVLEVDPDIPYAGLTDDGMSIKIRFNGRVSAQKSTLEVLEDALKTYFNSVQTEATLQPSSGFLKMTIKVADVSLVDENAPEPTPLKEEESKPPEDVSDPTEEKEPDVEIEEPEVEIEEPDEEK